jgi:hypothetical protein
VIDVAVLSFFRGERIVRDCEGFKGLIGTELAQAWTGVWEGTRPTRKGKGRGRVLIEG